MSGHTGLARRLRLRREAMEARTSTGTSAGGSKVGTECQGGFLEKGLVFLPPKNPVQGLLGSRNTRVCSLSPLLFLLFRVERLEKENTGIKTQQEKKKARSFFHN